MKTINIAAKNNAHMRTKNRIRDNGPLFTFIKELDNLDFFEGKGILVQSVKTEWFGWLPIEQLEIGKSNETNESSR